MDAIEQPQKPIARQSAKLQVAIDDMDTQGQTVGIAGDQNGSGPLLIQVGDRVAVVDRKSFLRAVKVYE